MADSIKEFKHPDQDEVRSISGGYTMDEEKRLEIDGREVLCFLGHGVIDSSCCGVGGCRFAHVPGFLKKYRARQDDDGRWVSEVEPIAAPDIRGRIKKMLEESEYVQQVNFEA